MNQLHPVIAQALRPFIAPYTLKPTEQQLQAADTAIEKWKGDHHARNDAHALRLQVAEQTRNDWSATL